MKYKVGDWIQLVDERPKDWNSQGEMDEFLGKTVKLTYIDTFEICFKGQKNWLFRVTNIAGYAKHKVVQDIIKDL